MSDNLTDEVARVTNAGLFNDRKASRPKTSCTPTLHLIARPAMYTRHDN